MDSNHCAGCHEPLYTWEAHKLRLLLSPPGFDLEDRALLSGSLSLWRSRRDFGPAFRTWGLAHLLQQNSAFCCERSFNDYSSSVEER
jgi:hypothetical protein